MEVDYIAVTKIIIGRNWEGFCNRGVIIRRLRLDKSIYH